MLLVLFVIVYVLGGVIETHKAGSSPIPTDVLFADSVKNAFPQQFTLIVLDVI
jgi:hypothetical protein